MKKYFCYDGKEKIGPLTYEELRERAISPDTFVWFQGLDTWTKAKNVLEIVEILELTPPPILNRIEENKRFERFSARESKVGRYVALHQFLEIVSVLFNFSGRLRRTGFCLSFIFTILFLGFWGNVDKMQQFAGWNLLSVVIVWFFLAQGAKRCHDIGQSGWCQLIPFYPVFMIFLKGQNGFLNKYGVNPRFKKIS